MQGREEEKKEKKQNHPSKRQTRPRLTNRRSAFFVVWVLHWLFHAFLFRSVRLCTFAARIRPPEPPPVSPVGCKISALGYGLWVEKMGCPTALHWEWPNGGFPLKDFPQNVKQKPAPARNIFPIPTAIPGHKIPDHILVLPFWRGPSRKGQGAKPRVRKCGGNRR